jgi:hypothetical protein
MSTRRLRDNVERWLIHENYSFKETPSKEDNFKMSIKHVGSFGNMLEIFEPKKQPNVIVIGAKSPLKNNQNARYLKLNKEEQKRFEKKVADFCYSIQAIHKFVNEDGKRMVGVYAVLDKEEQLTQGFFLETLQKVIEMSDKTTQYLMKTF